MDKEIKHIAIVCNPHAGNGMALQVANKIVTILKEKQIIHSLYTAMWPGVWADIRHVWIVGGDGTLNYFINQYPDIKLPLSIFKGGTGNDFQELLYKNISVEKQVEKILANHILPVDAGICNDRLFLNGVGIGFDGAIVKALLNKKKRAGQSTYMATVFKKIFFYKGVEHVIKFDEHDICQRLLMVNIANGQTEGGGFRIAPKAAVDDGKLDINIVQELNFLKRLIYLSKIEKGQHLDLSLIQYHQTEKLEISVPVVLPAHIDGEYFESDHFSIKCLPKRFSFLR